MKIYEPLVLVIGILAQIYGTRITLDDDAQALCDKYKMVCSKDKVCAVQHFEVPKQLSMPVCIPLRFVPVRNLICQLPPDPGRCYARYIRWYYNIHSQECSHFRYGGCHGNKNNFKSKDECQRSCIATPSINLFEGGQSSLMQPSILTAPVFEPPKKNTYEALNSVVYSDKKPSYDRYRVVRHRSNKNKPDEGNTRKRRRLEREKERMRRERRKERKRLKKLRRRQRNLKKGKKSKKGKKKKKSKNEVVTEATPDATDVATVKDANEIAKETKEDIINEIENVETEEDADKTEKEKKRKRKKRRNKNRKKRDRLRSRRHRPEYRRYGELKSRPKVSKKHKMFSILDQNTRESKSQINSLRQPVS